MASTAKNNAQKNISIAPLGTGVVVDWLDSDDLADNFLATKISPNTGSSFVRPDISTICLGQAASAAAVILAGGAKGKRYALEHSRILIHQPSSEGGGQASDIEIQAREIDRITRLQEDLLSRHVVKSSEEIRKDIERDKILTAAEAVEYGIIDQVLASRKAKPTK